MTREKRELAEQAAYWKGRAEEREQLSLSQQQTAQSKQPDILPEMFDTDAEYQQALINKAKEELRQEYQQEKATEVQSQKVSKRESQIYDAAKSDPSILEIANTPMYPPISADMLDAADGPDFAKIFKYLGENSSERTRIASLPKSQQIKEIGKIEAKLTMTKPKPKTNTKAPEPAPGITPGNTDNVTDDPKKRSQADNFANWARARKERLGVK